MYNFDYKIDENKFIDNTKTGILTKLVETYNYIVNYGYEKFLDDNGELADFQDDNWVSMNFFVQDVAEAHGELENFGTILRTVTIMWFLDSKVNNKDFLRWDFLIHTVGQFNNLLTKNNPQLIGYEFHSPDEAATYTITLGWGYNKETDFKVITKEETNESE